MPSATYCPWKKFSVVIEDKFIIFTPKAEATLEQIKFWFKEEYGNDKHYEWKNCGNSGDIGLYRQSCAPFRCDCRPLEFYAADDSDDE